MNIFLRTLVFLAALFALTGASEAQDHHSEHSPIPQAVRAIEQSLSFTDRRAVLAYKIRNRDRLRAERLSPLEGEVEQRRLIEWIKDRWSLSEDSEFRRYFSARGVTESQDIASFLIDVWVENYETGKIAEEKQFQRHHAIKELMKQFMAQERQQVTEDAQQAGTGQPATRPESKSEGGDKPQPEAEGRSR